MWNPNKFGNYWITVFQNFYWEIIEKKLYKWMNFSDYKNIFNNKMFDFKGGDI